MDIGKRITHFRTQRDYTTNKLAYIAGVSQSYLRDVELGNKNPTVSFLSLICDALDISLSALFADETDEIYTDALMEKVSKLSPRQKETLLAFLYAMEKEDE